MEIYRHRLPNYDEILIHGRDKNTSGFGKRTSAILYFYFRFLFLPNFRHRRVILHWPTKFRQNRANLGAVMTSYRFSQDGGRQAILDLIWIMLDHPRSAIVGLWLVLKFGLHRIYSFGDIAIFIFCRFVLILLIHAFGGLRAYSPK